MPDDTTQQDRQPPDRGTEAAGTAVALAAPDPWMPLRWRRFAAIVTAERRLHAAYAGKLGAWLSGLRRRVVSHGMVDQAAIYGQAHAFAQTMQSVVDVEIREIFSQAFAHEAPSIEPDSTELVSRYLAQVRNRLSGVPDEVFNLVREQTAAATSQGWSMDELAAKVSDVLSDNDQSVWPNRGMVVARTEAISAYNAGTFAGMQSYADQVGGRWEKVWIATEDERTRPTHRAADLQRQPLAEPFQVGGFPGMFPGDPVLPPQEVIQCRCSLAMVRPGELIDLSNRQFKGAP